MVTFEGASPAAGGDSIGGLTVEAGSERVTLRRGVPTEVDEKLAKAAQNVPHHNVTVESATKEGDS